MRRAASQIGWPPEAEEEALDLLVGHGCRGVEVAPGRLFPGWEGFEDASARRRTCAAYRERAAGRGLVVSSLQAVLYGRPQLQLFAPDPSPLRRHLALVAETAALLGAGPVVLGAPRNRVRGGLGVGEAVERAASFLALVGADFAERGAVLAVEPVPAAAGCDFLTDAASTAALVRQVGSPGVRLHLDAGALAVNGEDPAEAVGAHGDLLVHVHASQPALGLFDVPTSTHAVLGRALREAGYGGFVALEMRAGEEPLAALARALVVLGREYGP